MTVNFIPIPTFNLFLQIIILFLIVFGIKLVKDKAIRQHGYLMAAAVILNGVSILIVMGPSFIAFVESLRSMPLNFGSTITLSHSILGILAEALGITFLIRKFGNVKIWMRVITIIWIVALILGIAFYIYYYI